jgi:hypothetical protein
VWGGLCAGPMAHPELWYFLAPAEEGEEMNFNKMEEV